MAIINKSFGIDEYKVTYQVEAKESGQRLDQFLLNYLGTFSRQEVKRRIAAGDVQILGRNATHRPSTKVYDGDFLTLIMTNQGNEDEYWIEGKLKLKLDPDIIFEDENIIAIAKPPYMSAHPTGRHLYNCATVYFENIHKKTIHSIHRLDRETSGVMLLGKNPQEARPLSFQFENGSVKKAYFFIAKHVGLYSRADEFHSEHRLDSTEEGLKRVIIKAFPKESKLGKRAHTDFKILKKYPGYTIGLAFPHTGRQHQIRVHARENGLPLLGDKLYLGDYPMFQRFKDNLAKSEDFEYMEISRHALHAVAMKIEYQGEERIFKAPLPHDLSQWIKENLNEKMSELESLVMDEVSQYLGE